MRLIIWLLLAYVGYRIVKGFLDGRKQSEPAAPADTETYQDPICGMYVAADDAVIGRHNEQKLYFCSMNCLEKYREKLTAEINQHHSQEAP